MTVKDVKGNPISGQPVALSVSGSKNVLTYPNMSTDATGVVTATLASTMAESKTVTADIGAGKLTQPVTFVAGAENQAASTLVASPASLKADGQATTTLTVTVTDANGNPINQAMVVFTVSGSGNSLSASSGATAVDGTFAMTLFFDGGRDQGGDGEDRWHPDAHHEGGLHSAAGVGGRRHHKVGPHVVSTSNFQIVDDGLQFLPQKCVGQYCVSGGLTP